VQSIERENVWKAWEAQNDAIQWGVDVESVEVGDSSLFKNAVYVVTALWLCA
jgi:hypothetical protein